MDTFSHFELEYMHYPSLFSAKNDTHEIGINFILRSMTTTQRQIIKMIAKHQLENPEEKISMKAYIGKPVGARGTRMGRPWDAHAVPMRLHGTPMMGHGEPMAAHGGSIPLA